MEIYRKDQGLIARWTAGALLVVTAFLGSRELYELFVLFPVSLRWLPDSVVGNIPDWIKSLNWGQVVSLTVFILCLVGLWLVLNRPKVVDYLVETETEMRKVSWPSRTELWGATAVVLATLFMTGLFVSVIDYVIDLTVYGFIFQH